MGLINKVCVAGKNNIAVEIAEHIIQKFPKIELCMLINETDAGLDNWQRSLKRLSKMNGIKISSLEQLYQFKDLLFLSLEYDRIIDPDKFQTENIYNLHFSKLPKYKGMYTSVWPILNGERESGVTLHQINSGIDTGNIVSQRCFKLEYNDTARDLYFKYIKYGIILVKKELPSLLKNNQIKTQKQVALGSSYYAKNSIDFHDIYIDLKKTAYEIHNQIRAFNFQEYQLPEIYGHKINSSEVLNSKSLKKSGVILKEDKISITIATIDYDLMLNKDHLDVLFKACTEGNLIMLNEFLKYIEDINIQNNKGWTMLIVASYNNHKRIIKRLLMAGADINKPNYRGTTPLMYAKSACVNSDNYSALKILLEHEADICQKDNAGLSLIDYCEKENQLDVIKYIKAQKL